VDGNRTVRALDAPAYRLVTDGVGFAPGSTGGAAMLARRDGRLALFDVPDGARWSEQCATANGEDYPVARLRDGAGYYVDPTCVHVFGRSRLQIVPLGG